MRILKFRVENFLRLKFVEMTPGRNGNDITGRNRQGKTSLLRAIFTTLSAKKGLKNIHTPVHGDADEALLEMDLGEDGVLQYRIQLRIDQDGEYSLKVQMVNGDILARVPSPQDFCDRLLGSIGFDPLEFARAKPDVQRRMLAELLGIESQLQTIATDRKKTYDVRTEVNRQIKALEPLLAQIVPTPPPRIDVQQVFAAIDEIETHNAGIDKTNRLREETTRKRDEARSKAERLIAQAKELMAEAEASSAQQANYDKTLSEMPAAGEKKDPKALREQLQNAQTTNGKADECDRLAAKHRERQKQLNDLQAESDGLTKALEEFDNVRAALLTGTKMPIEGLGLTDEYVTSNGQPLTQASQAELVELSAAIAMRMHPELQVMLVFNANDLDEDAKGRLVAMAEHPDNDFQVWFEEVDKSGLKGFVIEDGTLVSTPDSRAEAASNDEQPELL